MVRKKKKRKYGEKEKEENREWMRAKEKETDAIFMAWVLKAFL